MQDIMQLYDTVRETAFAIHKYHKHGLLMNFGAPKYEIRKYALSTAGDDRWRGGLASLLVSLSSLFASFALFRG